MKRYYFTLKISGEGEDASEAWEDICLQNYNLAVFRHLASHEEDTCCDNCFCHRDTIDKCENCGDFLCQSCRDDELHDCNRLPLGRM